MRRASWSSMLRRCVELVRNMVIATLWWTALPLGTGATETAPTTDSQFDPAPCVAAAAANDDDKVLATCGLLIDSGKAAKADRVKALMARAGAYDRKGLIDGAIDDYGMVLQLDPGLADIYNARGVLWRRKGDRPRALQDFAAAIKINPNHSAARSNYKSLALELERLGALLALNNKPGFDCATTRRPVEKAICGNPLLVTLDREISAVNAKVVGDAAHEYPHAGRALQREQDDFIARRDAAFGQPDYDLQRAMAERLDHLLALERH
jgi:tetratricopeptide (TPR) repeat protein